MTTVFKDMLNPTSPVPLYHQLADLIREQIRTGKLKAGSRLPSEYELAATFGVGRPTVRQGTELLVRQGLLQRRRGAGTFVRQRVPEVDLFGLGGTLASFHDRDLPLCTEICRPLAEVRVPRCPDNPFSSGRALSFSRLSMLRKTPVLLEQMFLDPIVFAGLENESLSNQPLSALVHRRFGLVARNARQTFQVTRATEDTARLLQAEASIPILLVRRTLNFDRAPRAIYAVLHCRTDELVFAQTIGGVTHG